VGGVDFPSVDEIGQRLELSAFARSMCSAALAPIEKCTAQLAREREELFPLVDRDDAVVALNSPDLLDLCNSAMATAELLTRFPFGALLQQLPKSPGQGGPHDQDQASPHSL
jgi:hypothetical protein